MRRRPRRVLNGWKSRVAQWTIQREISLAILFTTLIPLLVSNVYLYYQLDTVLKERVVQYSNEVVRQAGESVDTIIRQTMLIKTQVVNWTIVNKLLERDPTPSERFSRETTTRDFLINLGITYPFVSSIYVIGEDERIYTGDFTLNREKLLRQPWISFGTEDLYAERLVPPHIVEYREPALIRIGSRVFSYVKHIVDYSSGAATGLIQIDIRHDAILSLVKSINLGEGSRLILVNGESGEIVSTVEIPDLEEEEIESFLSLPDGGTTLKSDLVIKQRLVGLDWYILGLIPAEILLEDFVILRRVTIMTILLLAAVSIFAGLMIASRITRPLTMVVERIHKLGHGDFKQRVPDFANHDLHILSQQFNQMADRIESLMLEAVQREKEKDQAELRALEAQINPHFLYNTLEVIRGISLEHQVPHVSAIAKSLASIFRYSINREKERVPLSRELQNVRNYITIQEHRYRRRFTYHDKVPEELNDIMVIRLILQPLVENIFAHVVEKKATHITIELCAELRDSALEIKILDNGDGIEPLALQAINTSLADGIKKEDIQGQYGLGIGLINVHNRIRLRFGRDWGLRIDSSSGGTTVTVRLPGDTGKTGTEV